VNDLSKGHSERSYFFTGGNAASGMSQELCPRDGPIYSQGASGGAPIILRASSVELARTRI
jgi:hypothetical protein